VVVTLHGLTLTGACDSMLGWFGSVIEMFYCKERGRLMTDWRDAVEILSEAAGQLEECKTDRLRFEERYAAAMLARDLAEEFSALPAARS
jgi:hypothetical protein